MLSSSVDSLHGVALLNRPGLVLPVTVARLILRSLSDRAHNQPC